MVTKKKLNSKMRDILLVVHRKGGSMTAHETARETGMSYVTVRKYLKLLKLKGVLIEHGTKKMSSRKKKGN